MNTVYLAVLIIVHTNLLLYIHVGPVAFSNAAFGVGTGSIYLDNLGCYGNESSLLNCSSNGIGNHNCVHSEDAGARCLGQQDLV